MSIRYKIQKKRNPLDNSAPEKYYMTVKSRGYIDRKDFIEQMVLHTSLTNNEAASALDYLLEALPRLLKMGFTVKLGELGYFRTTISSEGSEHEKDVTLANVRALRVKFFCGKGLRKSISEASLEKSLE